LAEFLLLIKEMFLSQFFRVESIERFYYWLFGSIISVGRPKPAADNKDDGPEAFEEDMIVKSGIFLDKWWHLFLKNIANTAKQALILIQFKLTAEPQRFECAFIISLRGFFVGQILAFRYLNFR